MTDRPAPKFKVGQVVILQSLCCPEHNGREMIVERQVWLPHATDVLGRPYIGWGYVTDWSPDGWGGWIEPSLRPLPDHRQPGSFEALRDFWQPARQGVPA